MNLIRKIKKLIEIYKIKKRMNIYQQMYFTDGNGLCGLCWKFAMVKNQELSTKLDKYPELKKSIENTFEENKNNPCWNNYYEKYMIYERINLTGFWFPNSFDRNIVIKKAIDLCKQQLNES